MTLPVSRRAFVTALSAGVAATAARPAVVQAPTVLTRRTVRPLVISDLSGAKFRNGGPQNCVEKAFAMITSGADVLDALIAGVNIPELDPEETGIGYGGLPNAEGIVQLDACCMHGPKKRAGGVAGIEGVRTPSRVAHAVMEHTDHHLLVGKGAQEFARSMGFTIEPDLNTERSRRLWLEWKRRSDPEHYLDPKKARRGRLPGGAADGARRPHPREQLLGHDQLRRHRAQR
jgi:N4-(beta-N-acetylglucosaminyl)-L-asparaginase